MPHQSRTPHEWSRWPGTLVTMTVMVAGGDGSAYRAWDLVARRHPVLVRRAHGRPRQIHRHLDRPTGFTAQQRGRVVVGLAPPAQPDAVVLQRSGGVQASVRWCRCARRRDRPAVSTPKSTTATVGMSGPHSSAVIHAVCSLGISPSRTQPPTPCCGSMKSKYQLSLHSGSSPGGWAPSSSADGRSGSGDNGFGQDGQCIGVEHVLAVALHHRHEHLVAAVGALDQHRRDDRHRHPEEARPADALANVVEAHRRVRPQGVVVGAQQCVVMLAAVRDRSTRSRGSRRHRSSRNPR